MIPDSISTTKSGLLWPEVLVLAICVTYFCIMLTGTAGSPAASLRYRLLSVAGILATAALIFLAIWPSFYTIIAIPVIPALFFFGAALFRPALVFKSHRLRVYLTACVVASAISWAFQIFWEFVR